MKTAACTAGLLLAAAFFMGGEARAASATDSTASGYSASVTLSHQISYPTFLRFQVGAPGATLSAITCNLTAQAASLGNGTNLPCTGGDLGSGASTVSVKSNAGQIRLTATTTGMLLAGAASIPYSEILTASNDANLPAPTLPSGGTSGSVNVALSAGSVTDRTASWTYTFDNTSLYASGTYGGVNVNNGRVTYTASSP
jgi:hypothetical protein